jgi:acyl-CoA synthetase (AMP-forming)/AMP-acid ligase II
MPNRFVENSKYAMNLRSILLKFSNSQGQSEAFLAPGRQSLTFAGLAERTKAIKNQLNSLGVGRGDRIAAVLPNGPETAVCYLAVAGCATFAPLNPACRQDEFEGYLKKLNPRVVIVPAEGGAEIRAACANMGVAIFELSFDCSATAGHFALEGETIGECRRPGWNQPEDIVLIIPTSGTTGHPKLVPLTQDSQLRYGAEMKDWLGIGPQDRNLHFMPMFHGHGLNSSLMCSIVCGSGIVCLDKFEVGAFFEALDAFAPTWYSAGFSYHRAILEASSDYREMAARSRLRFIRSGSGRLDPKVMKGLEDLFGAPVIERYGMTETHTITSNPLPPGRRKPGTVGLPVSSEVAIRDDDGKILEQGEIGEVVVDDEFVFSGYLDDPISNAKAFVDGWFRTGDLGVFDADGYLTITGRVDDVINRGGEKISPAEIDAALLAHPAVAEAVTFPMSHPTLGQIPVAAVVTAEGATEGAKDLEDFLSRRLAHFKVPSHFFFVDEIPKSDSGKIWRDTLAKLLGAPTSEGGDTVAKHEVSRSARPGSSGNFQTIS